MLRFHFLVIAFILFFSSCTSQEHKNEVGVIGNQGAIATAHPIASAAGLEILRQGGNAFDAAVAVHFALAVVYPRAGNIGGGGFAVFRLSDGVSGTLDFRETAPAQAHRDMYLNKSGEVIKELSRRGALAVGVPGSVDGIYQLHKRFGSKSWQELLAPAIKLALTGVSLTKNEADILNEYSEEIAAENAQRTPFVRNERWRKGDTLIQEALGSTLKKIQKLGRDGFYKGQVAQLIVGEMERNGGIITLEDLAAYKSKWREPVKGNYKDYTIISMPPPSSGGIALIQLMKGIEKYPLQEWGHNTAKTVHIMTELERRVYADRATYLGDPDYFPVPVDKLLANDYLQERFGDINLEEATSSQAIKEGTVKEIESVETTHYSIIDSKGNALSITTTLNGNFGSKLVVNGGGFFLNNEMDDFSAKTGVPNMYGLVGSEANEIAPGKRMLSSMTPTILEKNDTLFMVVGTPGGSTIITSVFQTILNVIEHDMPMQGAINAKRVHHQWLPDYLLSEKKALKAGTIAKLFLMGHKVVPIKKIGRVEGILVRANGTLEAGADHTRGDDTALAF